MATLGEAIDLVLTELARSDSSITVIVEREIRKAIEFYTPERFYFNEARVSFTASNTIFYPLSTVSPNLQEVDQLTITVNGSSYELEPKTHQEINRIDVSGATGAPEMWALFGEQFRLYPKPASGTTYQIDVDGTVRLPSLSATTSSNSWTTVALDLVCARAEKMVWAKRFKDPQKAATAAQVESEELQRLRDRTNRLQSTGRLKGNL